IEPILVTVQVPPGLAGPVHANVRLCATQRTSGAHACAMTDVAVPVVLQSFEVTRTRTGAALHWMMGRAPGTAGTLQIWRAPVDPRLDLPVEAAFELRAMLSIDETDWVDGVVPPGTDFVYRLVLVASDGRHVLGDVRFSNPSPARFRVLGAT